MTPDDSSADTLVSDLLFDALRQSHGKLEAGAEELGKNRSNFTRDAKKWAELLEKLGPKFLAKFGAGLMQHFGTELETPEQRVDRLLDEIDAKTREIRQYNHFKSEAR